MKTSPKEHVFKHIIFVNKLLQDLYLTGHKMMGEDIFKLLYETLDGQDMFLLENTWIMVQNCWRFNNLDNIVAYSRLLESFITTYKSMSNAKPNTSSLARKVPKVAFKNKVRKVTNEYLELISKSIIKSIPRKIIRINISFV